MRGKKKPQSLQRNRKQNGYNGTATRSQSRAKTYIHSQTKTGVAPVTHKTGGHCPTKRQNGCTAVALWLIEQKTRDTMAI